MAGQLIVTADDLGSRLTVNEAVEAAHVKGIVTAASLLVTGKAVEDAVRRVRRLPGLGTGLHLALCDARAVSPPEAIPDLVDEKGRFRASPLQAGLAYWRLRSRVRAQIEREIRAQVECYLAMGLPLDHVDGHHHMHMHPVVFGVLGSCLCDYHVGWVRLVREDAAGRVGPGGASDEIVAWVFAFLARRYLRRVTLGPRVCVADRVYGLRATGLLDERAMLRLAKRIDAPTVELYVHPDEGTAAGRREREALCSEVVRMAFVDAGYGFVSTGDLRRRSGECR